MQHYLLHKNTCRQITLNEESNNDGLNKERHTTSIWRQ